MIRVGRALWVVLVLYFRWCSCGGGEVNSRICRWWWLMAYHGGRGLCLPVSSPATIWLRYSGADPCADKWHGGLSICVSHLSTSESSPHLEWFFAAFTPSPNHFDLIHVAPTYMSNPRAHLGRVRSTCTPRLHPLVTKHTHTHTTAQRLFIHKFRVDASKAAKLRRCVGLGVCWRFFSRK